MIATGGLLGPAILSVGLLVGGFWDWETEASKRESDAEAALEHASFAGDEDRFASPPTVDDVAEVNTHRDGDPVYVPVIEVDLETTDEPDRDAAYRIAGTICRALRPAFADEHVRHYDVLFAFGERSWWEPREQRRIAVTPALVERLDREPDFDARDLRRAIEAADDGDGEIPPVAWGEPLGNAYYHGSGDDWAAFGASTGFM